MVQHGVSVAVGSSAAKRLDVFEEMQYMANSVFVFSVL